AWTRRVSAVDSEDAELPWSAGAPFRHPHRHRVPRSGVGGAGGTGPPPWIRTNLDQRQCRLSAADRRLDGDRRQGSHTPGNGRPHLSFKPSSPYLFYGGGIGPQSLRVTGRHLDGLISSGTFLSMVRAGRQAGLLEIADRAAREVDPLKKVYKVCELNLSISSD